MQNLWRVIQLEANLFACVRGMFGGNLKHMLHAAAAWVCKQSWVISHGSLSLDLSKTLAECAVAAALLPPDTACSCSAVQQSSTHAPLSQVNNILPLSSLSMYTMCTYAGIALANLVA